VSGPTLAVGVGCRKGCPAQAITGLVGRALERAGGAPAALFTIADKTGEAGLQEAARALGLPLVYLPRAALAAQEGAGSGRSERVVALFGVPSVAEAAALAGAGPGAVLLVPRMAADGATCAVAGPAPADKGELG
jgi:cobalt-precorrin 5A hydrolase